MAGHRHEDLGLKVILTYARRVYSWMNTDACAYMYLWVSVAIFQLVPIFLSVVAGMRLIKRKDCRIARLAFFEGISHQSNEMLVSRTVLGPTSFVCTALQVWPWFPRTRRYMDLAGSTCEAHRAGAFPRGQEGCRPRSRRF